MDKIKEIIKTKNFSINSLILKNIKRFNISINDFLLLLFFININTELDIESINNYTSLTGEEILSSFDNLIKNGLIEVNIRKNENKITEEISLDSFYNKLVLEMPQTKTETDIYSLFESEFGRTLSPIEYETISKWLESNISEDTIKSALKEAVLNGVSNLRYIDKIIYEWTKKKIKIKNSNEENTQIFDYDWLGEDNETK